MLPRLPKFDTFVTEKNKYLYDDLKIIQACTSIPEYNDIRSARCSEVPEEREREREGKEKEGTGEEERMTKWKIERKKIEKSGHTNI